ncbi:OmpA family protein [Fibrisoma montanum]|nr:OmpA family protein [Fibrisoma montanum]
MDLKASVTALVNGKRRKVGESNAAGHFTFQISDSTQALSFEVDGYPTKTIPVTRVGKMNANAQFMISVPVINRDSQQVARTYQLIDKPADKPRSLGKTRNVYFRVLHARTFRRIPATICFMDSRRGRTECVELDSAKVPSFVRLNPGEKMTFDVRADGYQPYRGELVVGQSGAADDLYQIKLLPLYNVLAVSYDMPANQKFRYEFRYATNKHFMSRLNVPIRFFDWGTFKPGQDYKFLTTTLDGHVVADETFRMGPGLNLAMFRLNRPGQSPLIGTEAQPSTFFDSTILYFDQSDYSLRSEVKGKLDTVAWRMINRRTMLGRITGYTDNVGERGLNMTLSEYRTRVVAQYLRQKGVGANQLSSSWKGSDAPAAPNDTEENRAKNRRVVIRFFTR